MSLLWVTDPHLNFLKLPNGAYQFAKCLNKENPDADGLVITGDISSGEILEQHLIQLSQGFPHPIYIVTGNHDHYNSSFQRTDDLVTRLTKKFDNLHWLQEGNHTYHGISIVGVGGWYDARHGNSYSRVALADFRLIEDLIAGWSCTDLLIELVRKRAAKEAYRLDELLLQEICDVDADVVLIATHVSPYVQSSWHEGKISDRDWLPWFCSHATGEVIDRYAENHPEKKFVVLVGHGHSPGIYERRDNLIVYTGAARYYCPELAGRIDVAKGTIELLIDQGKNKIERKFP